MLSSRSSRLKHALSRTASVGIVIVIIIIIAAGGYYAFSGPRTTSVNTGPTSSTTTAATSSTISSITSGQNSVPASLTLDTYQTIQYLDPTVDYIAYDLGVMNNVYEYLLWYNGTSGTNIIPWLAQNYTISSDHKTADWNLRSGIKFADGEQFNSTAAYFSIYRGFIIDGAAPSAFGYGPAWIEQQLANTSLSTVLSGVVQPHDAAWVNEVLGENFVQITGPSTFVMHLQHYDASFPYLFTTWGAPIVAPNYTMAHDVAFWNSRGYHLPYPTLNGNLTTRITQYFDDEVSTCGVAPTPGGCGETYYDSSLQGSLGGTGPYVLQSYNSGTQQIVLQANPNYWGGPYQFSGSAKIVPQIKTIYINFVPSVTTRELDLQTAGRSGAAFIAGLTNDHLYDVADRNTWLGSNKLVSVIPGVSLYGPYTSLNSQTIGFNVNVTNPQTATLYKFQPFADRRLRLAFADAVNISEVNEQVNNKMGQVEINLVPPGISPPGAYNASILPAYRYNPDESAQLLLQAMASPITQFTFSNGTAAPPGYFDNTFGCNPLPASGACDHPVPQTVSLTYATGDTLDQAILAQIAGTINNISSTYNMGLTVVNIPMPQGQLISAAFAGELYSFSGLDWTADYPWLLDYTSTLLPPGGTWFGIQHHNYTQLAAWSKQAINYSQAGDIANLLKVSSRMFQFDNNEVLQLYTVYPLYFVTMTSTVHGFFYNPAEPMAIGTFYFATMY